MTTDTFDGAPSPRMPRRRLVLGVVFVLALLGFLYFGLPQLAGLHDTWERIKDGNPWWLAVAALMELLSYAGYVLLFRAVFADKVPRIRWRESYLITMAGVMATRLLATAGAGGIALTAWVLHRAGLPKRQVASSMTTFMVLLYAVFFGAILLAGIGLRTGLLHGPAPVGMTIVPAVAAGVVIVLALCASLVPTDLDRRLGRRVPGWWPQGLLVRIGTFAGTVSVGVGGAIRQLREGGPLNVGALGWWGFDMGCLWACFHAFGAPPPFGVLVMGYFVGQLGNTLPLPGGVGGVEGGMIGAYAALGVPAGLALVAVLAYRAFSFWLPTVPGAVAYFRLTRTVRTWGAPA